jgi:hypothetical protein
MKFYDSRRVYVFVDDYDAAILKMIKDCILVRPGERRAIMDDIVQSSLLISSILGSFTNDQSSLAKLVLTGSTALLSNY